MFYEASFNLEHPEQKLARKVNRLKMLTSTKELFDRFLPSVKSRSQFHKKQDLYRKPLQTNSELSIKLFHSVPGFGPCVLELKLTIFFEATLFILELSPFF